MAGSNRKSQLSIGKLRHRITLQQYMTAKDSFGAEVKSWSTYAEVFASVEPLSGKELFTAQQLHAEAAIQVTIRYLAGVDTKMRLLYKDKEYDILSVVNKEERNIVTYLLCKEHKEGD